MKKTSENPTFTYGVAITMSSFLPFFNTPTEFDEELVDQTLSTLKIAQLYQQDHVATVFEKYNLPEHEDVDYTHPLYHEVTASILNGICPGERKNFQIFELEQFNSAVNGMKISYSDRKLLKYWLVKQED